VETLFSLLMRTQIAKILIAAAVGIISWQVAGNLTRTNKYYLLIGNKTEVPESFYVDTSAYRYPIELEFNQSYGIPSGSIAFALTLIGFFVPGILRREKE